MNKSNLKDSNKRFNSKQVEIMSNILKLFQKNPISEGDILDNLGLFFTSKSLSRILFLNDLEFLHLKNLIIYIIPYS